ncbi:MAG: molybdopterin molybdotransferase MoeA [Spirochaetes bacterium]|nr:molybdopterin molybdotransferase MoeA [Spirochaetota bacterium]
MISLNTAINIIKKRVSPLSVVWKDIDLAEGDIAALDIRIDIDLPPFNRAVMDGFAINRASYNRKRVYTIIGEIRAGAEPGPANRKQALGSGFYAFRIMTGAKVPDGFNAVIPIEESKEGENNTVQFRMGMVPSSLNIALKGSDCKKGRLIMCGGDRIVSANLPALLSSGMKRVKVFKRPDVSLLITGNELVEIDVKPKGMQRRNVNKHILKTLCLKHNINLKRVLTVGDNKRSIREKIRELTDSCDLLISTGAVSMGKYDHIPEIIREGYDLLFHKVAQRPGKPVLLGQNKRRKKYILGLPGNPLSMLSSFYSIGLPLIRRLSGFSDINNRVYKGILTKSYKREDERIHFVPAGIIFHESVFKVHPKPFHTSGDVISLIGTDGWFIADRERVKFNKGDKVSFFTFNMQL